MTHWLDRGADAWRLDAAYAVPPAFWAGVLPAVRERHPDVFVLGEVIHGDYASTVAASGMDAVTQYELWKAIWSSIDEGNFFEPGLDPAAAPRACSTRSCRPRSSATTTSRASRAASATAGTCRTRSRCWRRCRARRSSTPVTSLGLTGVKEDRAGGDDAVRQPFPATPDEPPAGADPDVLTLHRQPARPAPPPPLAAHRAAAGRGAAEPAGSCCARPTATTPCSWP
nr:hypothetical protein [Angustibacter aerolatus]